MRSGPRTDPWAVPTSTSRTLKYISKCVALIARSAGVSSIYFKYLFSLLESHPTLGNLIFNNDMIGKFNFFVEKMRVQN